MQMRPFTHGHFRSYDNDGSHTIQSAVVQNLMTHANFMAILEV